MAWRCGRRRAGDVGRRLPQLGGALFSGMVAGGSIPQFGALTAARWGHLLHGDDRIETAFSLESLPNDAAFIVGPAAAGAIARPPVGS